ncbi:protein DGCR6-like [Babylonia areolata]|uniref:protein DGCR6-like n=1 Tax=Babylonia areolata TaxID=304850 RepID=UPI003FD24AD3
MSDTAGREEQQRRHYEMLQELQNMAREIPMKYQQRLPYDLLSQLANSLLDGTVFEILKTLKELQYLEEKSRSTQRQRIVHEHKAQRHEMEKKHKELRLQNLNRPHNLPVVESQIKREMEMLKKRCDEELRRKDFQIMQELDKKVMDQQGVLEKAGAPGFFVTNNRQEIQTQMYLLDFMCRVAHLRGVEGW